MKAQQLVKCMAPCAVFGGVRNTSKSVYSSDSQLLLSRPSVSGAYLRSTQEKQLLGYQFYCFQYVAAVFFNIRYQLYYFQYVAADVFFFCHSCTVSSMQQVFFFCSCHRTISHDRIYAEQKESFIRIGPGFIRRNSRVGFLSFLAVDADGRGSHRCS